MSQAHKEQGVSSKAWYLDHQVTAGHLDSYDLPRCDYLSSELQCSYIFRSLNSV